MQPEQKPCVHSGYTWKSFKAIFVYISLTLIFIVVWPDLNAKPGPQPDPQNKNKKTDPKVNNINQIDKLWMKEINKTKSTDNTSSKQNTSDPKSSTTTLSNPGQANEPVQGLFPASEGPSFISVLFRFVGLMTFFIGGFYLLIQFMKKRGKGNFLNHNNGLVRVVLSVPLVQGKFLQIVDIAGTLMVLGVSDTGIQLIKQIDDGITSDKIRLWQSQNPGSINPAGLLESLTNMFNEADFKFWTDRKSRTENFEESLSNETPPRAKTPKTQNQADLFSEQPREKKIVQNDVDDIGNMLKKHERRLKALKKK